MKIAIVSHTFPTESWPSQGIVIKNEADLLQNFGHDVDIVIPQVISPFSNQQKRTQSLVKTSYSKTVAPYFSIPRKLFPKLTASFLKQSFKAVDFSEYDVIELNWLYPIGISAPYFKQIGKKAILVIHGSDWYLNFKKPAMRKLFNEAFQTANHIITVGNKLATDIKEEFPKFSSKITFIQHGIDTKMFSLKPKHNTKNDPIQLLCVANIFPVKGLDILLEALGLLNKKDIHLTIISSSKDDSFRRHCKSIIKKHALEDKVVFKGPIAQQELVNEYHKADVFVLPSRSEAFGLALAEAGSCGLPSIATKSGGPEGIITQETGFLVEPENIEALSEAVSSMLNQINNFDSSLIRQHIIEHFSLEKKYQRKTQLYTSL